MFFGMVLKPGVDLTPDPSGGDLLHLSQACLVNPQNPNRTYLTATTNGETFTLCVLQKDKVEQVSLDLFVSMGSEISFKTNGGVNEVHLTGYFEPEGAESDVDDIMDGESDEESDVAIEEVMRTRQLPGAAKEDEESTEGSESNDGEREDEDDEADNDGDGEDSGESEQGESDTESPAVAEKPPTKLKEAAPKKPAMKPVGNKLDKKRKAEAMPLHHKPSKQLKTEKKAGGAAEKKQAGSTGGAEAEFEKSVAEFLKKAGRQTIAKIGDKVKKPEALKHVKLGQFLRSRPAFLVDNSGNVSLKA